MVSELLGGAMASLESAFALTPDGVLRTGKPTMTSV